MERGIFTSRKEAESNTLSKCIDRYIQDVLPQKKGARKESSKLAQIKKHPVASMLMSAVRSSHVAALRDARLREVAPTTVVRELAVLSHVFTVARREWGMESIANPVELVRRPRMPKGRDRRPTTGELEAVMAASGSTKLRDFVFLLQETAMRRGELVALQWNNVDLERQTAVLPDTKNGEARVVPLSSAATARLAGMRPEKWKPGDRVFQMTADGLTRAFIRARERARARYLTECKANGTDPVSGWLQGIRIHDLRHEATTRFFERGLNVVEVASITGHKTLQMLRRYTHLRAEDLAKRLG
jgi:integrase